MRALGIILAGGNNNRMRELSNRRAIAAMPVAGSYRSIDFALSNMTNSHIAKVAVLTQYNARSLNEHLSSSKWWNFGRKQGGLFVFTPTITPDNSFWYRYEGTLKAGVNLETAGIEARDNNLTITLDPAYIISNTPDMESSGVLEERNNVLNPIEVGDVDAFQRWCVEQSEAQAVEGGLLDEAQAEAENQIRQLFYAALGEDVTVSFVWREAPAEGEAA